MVTLAFVVNVDKVGRYVKHHILTLVRLHLVVLNHISFGEEHTTIIATWIHLYVNVVIFRLLEGGDDVNITCWHHKCVERSISSYGNNFRSNGQNLG